MTSTYSLRLPFAPKTRKTDFLLGALFSSIHFLITSIVYNYVPDPYMDEICHIEQTRSYCRGNYTWNPLITTPPALYLISMPFCGSERYVNSILMFLAVPAFCRFRRMFSREGVYETSSIVASLPILVMSSVLFYTDLLSLTTVMWGFSIGNPFIAALCFAMATFCRQTNIIWAATYAAVRMLIRFDPNHKFLSIFSSLFILWPFELLAVGFLTFIYQNNFQIVLGDAKAHKPTLHIAQFWYMLAFCVSHSHIQFLRCLPRIFKKMANIKSLIFLVVIAITVHYFTFDHEYLLSDNRHYTFYLWRRILSKPTIRVAIAPIYLMSAIFMCTTTSQLSPFFKIAYIIGCILVLVPAHLFEMRYYIIPYTIWRLASTSQNRSIINYDLILELIFHVVVTSLGLIVFLCFPFKWEDEPDELQRFMF